MELKDLGGPRSDPPSAQRPSFIQWLIRRGRFFGAFFLILFVLGGSGLWYADRLRLWLGPCGAAADCRKTPLIVAVQRGDTLKSLGAELHRRGLLRFPFVFEAAGRLRDLGTVLQTGEYALQRGMTPWELTDIFVKHKRLRYTVVIPEGMTSWQVLERLRAQEKMETAHLPDGLEEGVILPGGYVYEYGVDGAVFLADLQRAAADLLARMWAARAEGLPLKTPRDAVILASIVEKETGCPQERPKVAAVFINRLRRGQRLQSDPTVIYGITAGRRHLGHPLRRSELRAPTPYNTYVIKALPLGPITNPSAAALEAVLHPADSDALYFVADGSGCHAFARTIGAHEENIKKWRLWEKNHPQMQIFR